MEIIRLTDTNHDAVIAQACQVLKTGGLVIYPTETTYGIGADCENEMAIARLIAYKSKRDGKPLSVAVANQQMAEMYVSLNDTARGVYTAFLPGPVTVISQSTGKVAPGVASEVNTVGIRIPNFPLILKLLQTYGKGITATGANASYQKRPYTIQDIFDNISEKQKSMIDLVIDVGELPHNEPSTVIDTTMDDISVTRFGDIPFTNKEVFASTSVTATKDFAAQLMNRFRNKLTYEPLIFALQGPMGAGKTHMAKGFAAGLRITETVTSPTYSLASEYEFINEGRPGRMVHIDTWRMQSSEDLEGLSLADFIAHNAVVVIEWADKFTREIQKLSPSAHIVWISIDITSENERSITCTF